MYKSAVNSGAAGYDPVGYMQDGEDLMLVDLQTTAPGSDPAYLDYLPREVEGDVPEDREDRGMGSVLWNKLTGDDPTGALRESARVGGSRTAALYGSDPGFMARPGGRHDMATYPGLEDTRAHMPGSAIMAREYGPETAETVGTFNKFLARFVPFPLGGQNTRDVAMDQRNNAVGRQIFMKAGIDATPQQLTQMVDAKIFRQLDVIMGRSSEAQMTPAPEQLLAPGKHRNYR